MKLMYFSVLFFLFSCFHLACSTSNCMELEEISNSVSYFQYFYWTEENCWSLPFEDDAYVTLNISRLILPLDCDRFYVSVTEGVNETYRFCNDTQEIITSSENITIKIVHEDTYKNASTFLYFNFEYKMFRSVLLVESANETRKYLISRLYDQSNTAEGWGEETHRAMTALYLAGAKYYVREKRLITELDLCGSSALLKNSTHPLSVNELGMFVNALTATCQDSRQFYDQNLLQILEQRATSSMILSPSAILSVCIAGGKLERDIVDKMFYRLMQNSTHGFSNDHKAMSLMALTCLKKQSNNFENNPYASAFYNATIQNLVQDQGSDGSFGNVYTTALVTQALLGTGQVDNRHWRLSPTVRFLMNRVNSSEADLQMTCLILPILNNKSLVDLREIDCSSSEQNEDDFQNGKMIQVFYSLFIGDQKKVIKTISVVVPANSSAYGVMNKAQRTDPVFKFQSMRMADSLYIYKINGIANDFEAAKIWTLYTMPSFPNGTLMRQDISADKLMMHHWEHLIMWYKTIHL